MINDVINAVRQWLRTPVVTAVALLSLALGIGVNVALFGVVDALLLKSLPIHEPQSLVRLVSQDPEHGDIELMMTTRGWEYMRDRQPFAESVLALSQGRVNLARGGEARFVQAVYLNGTGLDTLGVAPVIGRTLQGSDDADTADTVAVISYALWQRDYQGQADAIGQTIWLNNHPFTIIGVAPRAFYGVDVGQHADVFVTLSGAPHIRRGVGNTPIRPDQMWLSPYARLRRGQSIEAATAALRSWLPELREATRPAGPDGQGYLAHPASAIPGGQGMSYLRAQYQRPLFVLLGAVALVLVIACANLAALVLARFSDRRHELGVRLALGAGRARIMRMLVAESVALAVAGGGLGLLFAQMFVGAMIPYLGTATGPRAELAVTLDARLLTFAAVTALLSGIVAGLLPAWRASRVTPQLSISSSSRGGMHGKQPTRALRWMVAGQVGLSLVLVAGASVMVRSFIGLATASTGVDEDRVLIAQVSGALAGPNPERRYEVIEEIRRALGAVPGVHRVSGGMITPLSSSMAAAQIVVPGSIHKPGDNEVRMNGATFTPFNHVLPQYFATIGTPILVGRDFDERDGTGSPLVSVVNQAFATRHFGDASPIGRTVNVNGRTLEIVGLAADSKQMGLKDTRPIAMGFGAFTQLTGSAPIPTLRFAVRVDRPDELRIAVASALRAVDPRLSIEFRTMREQADATINRERLMAGLAGLFALIGLAMAVIGLYGTFTYAVTRRRSEIGVRIAVGADRADILRMIMREASVVLIAGVLIGVAGALATGQILQGLLFSVSARDPWMLATAVSAVVGAACIASLIPARRASLTDPMVALRDE